MWTLVCAHVDALPSTEHTAKVSFEGCEGARRSWLWHSSYVNELSQLQAIIIWTQNYELQKAKP